MEIRGYDDADWEAVRDVYDLARLDELREVVDSEDILPIEQEPCRRKFGRALLEAILSRLTGEVTLNVGSRNAPALELYREFGFIVQRRFRGTLAGNELEVLRLSGEGQA